MKTLPIPNMPLAPAGFRWIKPVVCSRRERWCAVVFLVAISILLITCASVPPRAMIIPRPAESRAVSPTAEKVRTQVDGIRDTTSSLRTGMDSAVAEADRLRRQKSASEAELNRMWAELTKQKQYVDSLWKQVQDSRDTIAELSRYAAERDAEVDTLRQTVDTLNCRLADASDWMEKAKPKVAVYDWWADKWSWLMHRIYWIIGLSIMGGVIYVIVRYWPAIAARFFKPFP